MIDKTAILVLSYADFESLEITLAVLTRNTPARVKIFILQNGRGSYDTERTYRVALRYQALFPQQVEVVDWIQPGYPYDSIATLLNSEQMQPYHYICKIDDDVFPITESWLEDMVACYQDSVARYGEDLGYVTSLVNNNPWGFAETLEVMGLMDEYRNTWSRAHFVGLKGHPIYPQTLIPQGEIGKGGFGTIWWLAYLARWLHQETTLKPELYIEKTRNLPGKEVNNQERYSINCMLFRKDFWECIRPPDTDDEYGCYLYCSQQNKKIIAAMNVPMVHLFFCSQREENRDLIGSVRDCYEKRLGVPFPISMCTNKEIENENRLRMLAIELQKISDSLHNVEKDVFKSMRHRLRRLRYKVLSHIGTERMRRKSREKLARWPRR